LQLDAKWGCGVEKPKKRLMREALGSTKSNKMRQRSRHPRNLSTDDTFSSYLT
jgi:hypothetical protein